MGHPSPYVCLCAFVGTLRSQGSGCQVSGFRNLLSAGPAGFSVNIG